MDKSKKYDVKKATSGRNACRCKQIQRSLILEFTFKKVLKI